MIGTKWVKLTPETPHRYIQGLIMQWKYLWLVLLFAFSGATGAENEDYKICAVGGYFSGAEDKFLSGLAAHLASKKKILTSPICVAVWKNAHAFGVHHSKTGKI